MGYTDTPRQDALEAFKADYRHRTQRNRRILDHLLHDAFADDEKTEPEVDLVLDPEPDPQFIAQTLSRYGFQDLSAAYQNLVALSVERIRFFSTRRCRHFSGLDRPFPARRPSAELPIRMRSCQSLPSQ